MSDGPCCCFCLNLRTGSYMSAGYSIALGVIGIIASLILAINTSGSLAIMSWVIFVAYVLWVIFAIVLIIGVNKSSKGYLVPWIVLTIILSVLVAISIILALISAKATFGNSSGIINFIVYCVILALNIYALWCVISLHRRDMVA